MPMRPTSGSQVSLLSRFLSFPTARRRVRRPPSSVAIPAESYPRYSSRLSASRIGAAAGPRPTTPTIPHILFSDSSTVRRMRFARSTQSERNGGHAGEDDDDDLFSKFSLRVLPQVYAAA